MKESELKARKIVDLNIQEETYQFHVQAILKQEIVETCLSYIRTHGIYEMFTWLLIERNKWYRMTDCSYSSEILKFIEGFIELQLELINFNRDITYAVQHFELVEQKYKGKELQTFHDWYEFNFGEENK